MKKASDVINSRMSNRERRIARYAFMLGLQVRLTQDVYRRKVCQQLPDISWLWDVGHKLEMHIGSAQHRELIDILAQFDKLIMPDRDRRCADLVERLLAWAQAMSETLKPEVKPWFRLGNAISYCGFVVLEPWVILQPEFKDLNMALEDLPLPSRIQKLGVKFANRLIEREEFRNVSKRAVISLASRLSHSIQAYLEGYAKSPEELMLGF